MVISDKNEKILTGDDKIASLTSTKYLEEKNISPDVIELIQKYIDGFVDWDLFIYLHHNPEIKQSSSQIAISIGRNENDISARLKFLASKGLLGYEDNMYYTTFNNDIKAKVKAFAESVKDRTMRIMLVSIIVQKDISKTSTYKFTHKIS